jgi:hypothetical protein
VNGWRGVDVVIFLLVVVGTAGMAGLLVATYWVLRAGWREWHEDLGKGVKSDDAAAGR